MLRRDFLKAALAVLAAPAACLARLKPPSTKDGTLVPAWPKEAEAAWGPRAEIVPAIVVSAITPICPASQFPHDSAPGIGIVQIRPDKRVIVRNMSDLAFAIGDRVRVMGSDYDGTYFVV